MVVLSVNLHIILFVYFRLKFILLLSRTNILGMIRQSLVDERVSALHHHSLQSSGDSDGEMSKPASRRAPAPVASRIVIKKNASLLPTGDEPVTNTPSTTPSPTPTVDPRSRVELLERNLRYVQQQHEITLTDLHREISRLQQENRGKFFELND